MRSLISLGAVLLALGFAACDVGNETSATSGATGTTGVQGPAGDAELTASEFVKASAIDQIEAVTRAAEDNPDCAKADTAAGSDFQVSVAIDASNADPDTPIAEIVADNC